MADQIKQLSVTLHPTGVTAPALRAMQESTEVIVLALEAVAKADLSVPIKPSTFFGLVFEHKDPKLTSDQRRIRYANWLLVKGFQDLARGLRLSLEEGYFYIGVAKIGQQKTTWGEFNATLETLRNTARKLNFPDLMTAVNAGLTIPLQFEKEFLSLQKVRNCLEHRNGVVSSQDVNTNNNSLMLTFPRMALILERAGVSSEINGEFQVLEGDRIFAMRIVSEREYKLGEQITFSAQEFYAIATGCFFFTTDIAEKLPMPKAPSPPSIDEPPQQSVAS